MNYSIIESEEQYNLYCKRLRELSELENNESYEDEMEQIEVLLEAWDNEKSKSPRLDHIQFLKALMDNHNLSLNDIANITDLSSHTVIQMLNYEIDIPQEGVKKLAKHFSMVEEAFMSRVRIDIL